MQIKSNRGVSQQVDVPGTADYVYVDNLGVTTNRQVILPAGATMTVGYRRPPSTQAFDFAVSGTTPKAALDTLVRGVVDFAGGYFDNYAIEQYVTLKCAAGFSVGISGAHLAPSDLTCSGSSAARPSRWHRSY